MKIYIKYKENYVISHSSSPGFYYSTDADLFVSGSIDSQLVKVTIFKSRIECIKIYKLLKSRKNTNFPKNTGEIKNIKDTLIDMNKFNILKNY